MWMGTLSHRKYAGMARQTALLSQHSVSLLDIPGRKSIVVLLRNARLHSTRRRDGFLTLVHAHDIDDTCLSKRNAKLLGDDF